jgi:hypothetical protein
MKTVTEKYHAVNEGTLSKAEFVRQMRLAHPQIISQFNGFDDSVQILKNRGLLFEKKEEVEYENPSYNLSPDTVRRGLRYELILAGLDPAGDISEEDYMKAHKKAEDNIMKDQLHYYRMIADDKTKIEHDKMKETKRGAEETDTDNAMAKVELNENVNKKQLIRESVKSCTDIIKVKYPNATADDILDFFNSLDQEQLNQMYNDDPAFDCEQEYDEYLIANRDSLDEKESTVVDKKAILENAVHSIKQVFPELTREIFKAYIDTHYTDLLNDPKIDVANDFIEWAYVNGYMDDKPASLDETESSINERVGSLGEFISLIHDRAKDSEFSEAEEALEVIEAIADHYGIKIQADGPAGEVNEGRRSKTKGGKIVTENDYETGGYVEAMGPMFDRACKMLMSAWEEWKNGPMTEPGMIEHAKRDVIEYIDRKLEEDILQEKKGKDHDGDGDIDSDDYMAAKDKAIKKAMGKDVNEAEEKIKRALKKKIVQILEEGSLNEAATNQLAKLADEYAGFNGMKGAILDLQNIVTDIESYYDKTRGKIQRVYDMLGEVRNEEGLKVGAFIAPAIESAFNKDLRPVTKEGFTKGLNTPKVRTLSQADIDAAGGDLEEKQTVFNENKKTK